MNKKLVPYYEYAARLKNDGKPDAEILDLLKQKGSTIAVAIKTMEKLGLDLDDIDALIKKSSVWKNDFTSFEDLFFDFIELDDDLISDKP